jgi:hypothetical protein
MKQCLITAVVGLAVFASLARPAFAQAAQTAMRTLGKEAARSFSDRSEAFDTVLADASAKMNARLPMQLDKDTRLDTTLAGPGNRMTYSYTLINLSAEDGDGDIVSKVMRPKVLNAFKTDPQFAVFREHRTEMHLIYRDKDGKFVTRIVISPNDLQ